MQNGNNAARPPVSSVIETPLLARTYFSVVFLSVLFAEAAIPSTVVADFRLFEMNNEFNYLQVCNLKLFPISNRSVARTLST